MVPQVVGLADGGGAERQGRAIDGDGWKDSVVLPLPRPRAALTTLLLWPATRPDATATFAQRQVTTLSPASPA
jgi:hypothetical protein